MRLCYHYQRKVFHHKLTPTELAYIRWKHADEIAASARPLDESKRKAKRK
jgi:hypothetical protein